MPSTNQVKLTVGLENTAGVEHDVAHVVPISSLPGVDRAPTTGEDPAIVGNNMVSGYYMLFADVTGETPLAVRPVGALGVILKSLLGTELGVHEVGAAMRFKYNGAAASCKISLDATAQELISLIGGRGSETAGGQFGHLDLTATGNDTVAELISTINNFTGYAAEAVFGAGTLGATYGIAIDEAEGKDTWVYVWFEDQQSGAYRHEFVVDLTETERETFTAQKDNFFTNTHFRYAGCVTDTVQFSGALKAMIEGNFGILGMTESITGSASALSLEDFDPLIFYAGDISLAGTAFNYPRNFEVNFANNHNPDGYGMGSLDRQYQQKGQFACNGNVQLRLDAPAYALRAAVFANTRKALSFQFSGGDIVANVPEFMLIELPYCSLTSFEWPENAGQIDANIPFNAVSPKGAQYSSPVKITLVNEDSAAYAPA